MTLELEQGLVTLGYLAKGDHHDPQTIRRAVTRFQRHAARTYRMPQPDVSTSECFRGPINGTCDDATAKEIQKWLARQWTVPVGRFRLQAINAPGTKPAFLRSDAAIAWSDIVRLVASNGGVLDGDYGDSARAVRPTSKAGASHYSFHYAARAVDICQEYTLNPHRRYWVAKDPMATTCSGDSIARRPCRMALREASRPRNGTHSQKRSSAISPIYISSI